MSAASGGGAITVVVPCYNLGSTLPETLASVRAQSRPVHEIIIVDDGSADALTRWVLARLRREGLRVITHERNRGPAAARNTGFAAATTEYVVNLDADDLWTPDFCEKMAGELDADPALDFVSCALRAFGGAEYTWTPLAPEPVDIYVRGGPHASTLMRRAVWAKVGGFDETLREYELTDFWLGALARGFRGKTLDAVLLNYRVRNRSRYTYAIGRAGYADFMAQITAKHRDLLAPQAARIIVAREQFRRDMQGTQARLRDEIARATEELAALSGELAEQAGRLRDAGAEPLTLGDAGGQPGWPEPWRPLAQARAEQFFRGQKIDWRGRVLEIRAAGAAAWCAVLPDIGRETATLVGGNVRHELAGLPDAAYDCVLLVGVPAAVDDDGALLARCRELLKPSGVLLAVLPGICPSPVRRPGGDYRRYTPAGARELAVRHFPAADIEVAAVGDAVTVTAAAQNLAGDELPAGGARADDAGCPLLVTVRAVRGADDAAAPAFIIPEPRADTALILAYHRVADLPHDEANLCVRPDAFRAQMQYLRDHCQPLPLTELAAAAAAGDLRPGSVAVTFDDGYRDALTTAAPVLRELKIPATFFVTSGALAAEAELWWDIRTRIFRATGDLPPYLEITLGGARRRLPVRYGPEREAALQQLHAFMMSADGEEQRRVVGELAEWSGLDLTPRATHRLLRADEIVRLGAHPGISIGSHTLDHRSLPDCPPAEARQEIAASRARLEQLLGRPVSEFCYPYGEYNSVVAAMVAAAGYTVAVTVEDRAVAPGEAALLLPRCEIIEQAMPEFSRRLARRFAGE